MIKHNKFSEEVENRWGKETIFEEYKQKTKHYSDDKWGSVVEEMDNIFKQFAEYKKSNFQPNSLQIQNLVKELQNFITQNYYTCTNETLARLGEMYVSDERFKNNIDIHGKGTAEFVSSAIQFYCSNQ